MLSLKSRIQNIIDFMRTEEAGDLQSLRERFLPSVLWGGVIFGAFAFVPNAIVEFQNEEWVLLGVTTFIYSWLIVSALYKKLPYIVRALSVVVGPSVIAITFMLDNGLEGDGMMWLLFASIFASAALELRAGIIVLVVNMVMIIVLGNAFITGAREVVPLHSMTDATEFSAWGTTWLDFLLLGGVGVIYLISLFRKIETSLQSEKKLSTQLAQRRKDAERFSHQILQTREDERKRIARELHDEIIQSLVVLGRQVEQVQDDVAPRLRHDVQQLIDSTRHICADLRPPALDAIGLIPVIKGKVREMAAQAGIRSHVVIEGDEEQDFPEDISITVFRALQEALHNICKHAQADCVEVRVIIKPAQLFVCILDDGKGFILPPQIERFMDAGHFGLVGLRERLDLANGMLELHTQPGEGVRVEMWIPLPSQNEPER